MKRKAHNRPAFLLGSFANNFELPYKPDEDSLGADLGIPYKGKTITAGYAFDGSEDSYGYVAAVGQVQPSQIPDVAARICTSEPIRGVTERITPAGKHVVLGSRDNLNALTDAQVENCYMDDVSRITRAFDQFNELKKT